MLRSGAGDDAKLRIGSPKAVVFPAPGWIGLVAIATRTPSDLGQRKFAPNYQLPPILAVVD